MTVLLVLVGGSVIFTWLYVHSSGSIVLTTIFHAAQSCFVIVNEGIALEEQMWLMVGVYLPVALVIASLCEWHRRRTPTANRTINHLLHLQVDDTPPG